MQRIDQGLHRLLYRSSVAILGTSEQVEATIAGILQVSRRRNAADGLTGVLLHAAGGFTQVIEGTLPAIERVYDRISADLRHSALEILQFVPAQERFFAGRPMVYLRQDNTTCRGHGPGVKDEPGCVLNELLELLRQSEK